MEAKKINTKDFRTRTIIAERDNPKKNNGTWDIGIDMGYSSVKIMCPNGIICFPAFVKKLAKGIVSLAKPNPQDIMYRDTSTGDVYAVGQNAQEMISLDSANDTNTSLYGRNRYYSESFQVCKKVGLGLALMKNKFGNPEGKRIRIQTGLPSKYLTADNKILASAFVGDYDFEIKIGAGEWMHFTFSITKDDIFITQQPMGSLVSVAMNKDGKPTADAEALYRSKTLVFDPGFRTGDSCLIRGGQIDIENDCQTFESLSMISVLQKTCDELANFGTFIPIPAIQPILEKGYVNVYEDGDDFTSHKKEIAEILEEKSREVCNEAIKQLSETYNKFKEIDFLVLTGGTGAAWSDYIRDRLKGLETLTILSGNRNDDLPHIFSNVRGYYLYLINHKN